MFAGDAERVESAGEFLHDGKSRLEREADWFASELLAPASELGPCIDDEPASIGTLQSLADEFRTSLTMMAIRHAELTGGATASILSRDGRVEWVFFSRRLARHEWSRALGGAIPSRRAPQP